jgi:hypothetical protein
LGESGSPFGNVSATRADLFSPQYFEEKGFFNAVASNYWMAFQF